ncbi:MAG: transcriptional repressor LexA [Polyangiaceae bacterium]
MRGVTKRQLEVLQYIREYIAEQGFSPTIREIGRHFGISSTNGVNDHLRALELRGYLTRSDMKSRTLRPTNLTLPGMDDPPSSEPTSSTRVLERRAPLDIGPDSPPPSSLAPSSREPSSSREDLFEVPILGRVSAGQPIYADENVLDTMKVDPSLVRGCREAFGLRISGLSMIEAGILDGDYVFVKPGSTARNGQIVVALIGDEATVKYFYKERDFLRFEPANREMAPILVRPSDQREVSILGTVIGVYRRIDA